MRKLIFFAAMVLCAGPLVFSQVAGSQRYVAVQNAVLKNSTGFFAKSLANLPLGTEVTVILENGKWTQVRAGNQNGWVASTSLSVRKVVASNSTVTANDVALAGKGFNEETEMEYKKNGLDYSMVDSMERITILSDDLLRFITEGRLSKGE
jgi:SH3-like domain-containing protein